MVAQPQVNEVQMFTRVANDNLLRRWLEEQKAAAMKLLVAATDMQTVNRAQGAHALAEKQLQLMAKAAGQ